MNDASTVSADAYSRMTRDELRTWQLNRTVGDQVWWAADNDTGYGPGVIAERHTEDDGALQYRICAYAWPDHDNGEPGGQVDDIHVGSMDIRPICETTYELTAEEQAKLDEITASLRNR